MKPKTKSSPAKAGSRHRLNNGRERLKVTAIFMCFLMMISFSGCEAFVKKFRRKPREEKREEPVIQPENYPDVALNKDELYRDYFLFWESWADELVSFLKDNANAKKQKECVQQALDNLVKMQSLLNDDKAKSLDRFIQELTTVKNVLFQSYLNSADFSYLKNKMERIKSRVRRDFIFSKAKKDLR